MTDPLIFLHHPLIVECNLRDRQASIQRFQLTRCGCFSANLRGAIGKVLHLLAELWHSE